MKVLVIGSGGREHAIVEALSRSPRKPQIYAAPGNAGIAALAECVAIKDTEADKLLAFAQENGIELTVVGPEAALAVGVVDKFRAAGLKIFGPTKAATEIESSKDFAKRLMKKYDVPTADYATFSDFDEALAYVRKGSLPTVLKYDGLAAGKGRGHGVDPAAFYPPGFGWPEIPAAAPWKDPTLPAMGRMGALPVLIVRNSEPSA